MPKFGYVRCGIVWYNQGLLLGSVGVGFGGAQCKDRNESRFRSSGPVSGPRIGRFGRPRIRHVPPVEILHINPVLSFR